MIDTSDSLIGRICWRSFALNMKLSLPLKKIGYGQDSTDLGQSTVARFYVHGDQRSCYIISENISTS
jgi:hypothetical protein